MSATNSTPIINLPLFIGTDKPAWLTDWNGAMNIIDTAIANLQTAESGTATSLASLAQSVEALSGTVSQHTTAIQTVTTATAGNTGSINTINSLIGNGLPTTEDKTIIGAINEIYAEIGGGTGVAAEDVTYSNTSSGLTATDVQAAIDEVNAKIPAGGGGTAADISYDNTSSGMTADDVQEAIDELHSDINTVDAKIVDKPSVDVLQGYVTAEVKSGILFINVKGYVTTGANTWVTVGQLPAAYKPAADAYGLLYNSGGTASVAVVASSGDVQINAPATTSSNGVLALPL